MWAQCILYFPHACVWESLSIVRDARTNERKNKKTKKTKKSSEKINEIKWNKWLNAHIREEDSRTALAGHTLPLPLLLEQQQYCHPNERHRRQWSFSVAILCAGVFVCLRARSAKRPYVMENYYILLVCAHFMCPIFVAWCVRVCANTSAVQVKLLCAVEEERI